MVRRIDDFIQEWAYESESTSKVIAGFTDQSLPSGCHPRPHRGHPGVASGPDDSRDALAHRVARNGPG